MGACARPARRRAPGRVRQDRGVPLPHVGGRDGRQGLGADVDGAHRAVGPLDRQGRVDARVEQPQVQRAGALGQVGPPGDPLPEPAPELLLATARVVPQAAGHPGRLVGEGLVGLDLGGEGPQRAERAVGAGVAGLPAVRGQVADGAASASVCGTGCGHGRDLPGRKLWHVMARADLKRVSEWSDIHLAGP
jgi:hypothetical protein